MAVEGSGLSENVFIQSPGVRFGEPPSPAAQSSLLTFADIVLSFDRKTALQNTKSTSESNLLDESKSRSYDHTYASCRSARTTRSQTAKEVHLSGHSHDSVLSSVGNVDTNQDLDLDNCNTNSDTDSDFEMELDLELNSQVNQESQNNLNQIDIKASTSTRLPQIYGLSQTPPSVTPEPFIAHNYCVRTKRCSSEENISVETLQSSKGNAQRSLSIFPPKLDKHSKKSCSSENVERKSRIKSCKSSESMSQTLHKFINNTLEFPCWPRKADHTYATATWDGTAASHSLFEEGRSLHSKTNIPKSEDCPMEESNSCISSPLHPRHETLTQPLSQFSNFNNIQQKEDHTYVKHVNITEKDVSFAGASSAKSSILGKPVSHVNSHPKSLSGAVDSHSTWPNKFSSATFPRLKSREDHTYFHTGLSGCTTASARGGREWMSAHTVASSQLSQDMQIEETYRSLHSFSQSASAKKDHNYSTSA